MIKISDADDEGNKNARALSVIEALKAKKMISLYIEPASACNLTCKFCDLHADGKGQKDHKEFGIMTMQTYEKILIALERLSFKYVNINFFLHGEPLLNKNIFNMIRAAKEKKLAQNYVLTTNGLLMGPKNFDKLIESGLGRIIVSLDTIDREYYKEFKGSDALPTILENISYAIKNLPKDVLFEIKCTLVKKNNQIKNKSEEKIIDYFRKDAESSQNVNVCIQYEMTWPDRNKKFKEPNNAPCELPFYQTVINYDGTVTCCCVDITNSLLTGDVKSQDLADILRSQRLREIRKNLLSKNLNSLSVCQNCGARSSVDFEGCTDEVLELI